MDFSKIDKNFEVDENIKREGLKFYNIKEEPFLVHGIYHDGKNYRRISNELAEKMTSSAVSWLSKCTAGGRVRFVTDSPYVIIRAEMSVTAMPHMPETGVSGFDMYERVEGKEYYLKTFTPTKTHEGYYYGIYDFNTVGEHTLTINFPLYNTVNELYVGLKEDSVLLPAPDYSVNKPIVYYGSSITQGGCASRPGTSYQAIVSRKFDCDYINLGFSGSALGEECVAEYIAKLDMSVFVLDYDCNASTPEHLLKTHKPFFDVIRKANPTLPIVIMPCHPAAKTHGADFERVIIDTYDSAVKAGDKNVYYIPKQELMPIDFPSECTVDGLHPTDLGFYFMANAVINELKKIF